LEGEPTDEDYNAMSLLSHDELVELIRSGVLDAPESAVNAASIDLTLAPVIMAERPPRHGETVSALDISRGAVLPMEYRRMHEYGGEAYYDLMPGEFILASTVETFNLPNWVSSEYMQKSSLARNALEHLAAGWCDAGWHGSNLTLELVNVSRYYPIRLRPGMPIGQMKFLRHKPVTDKDSYASRGQYNGDSGVTQTKVLR
jgi:dCTP deaminase